MGERHRTYRRVMCLEDGFEVEGEPIPEREFSAGRASENAAGFRCPLHPCSACGIWVFKAWAYRYNVHWTSNFICRSVYKFRA